MSIDSLLQVTKLPTADLRNILPLCKHMPVDGSVNNALLQSAYHSRHQPLAA